MNKQSGFICPEWARQLWSVDNLSCLTTTEGQSCLVDMNLQTTVFVGTLKECFDFITPFSTTNDRSGLFGLDVIDLFDDIRDLSETDRLFMDCRHV